MEKYTSKSMIVRELHNVGQRYPKPTHKSPGDTRPGSRGTWSMCVVSIPAAEWDERGPSFIRRELWESMGSRVKVQVQLDLLHPSSSWSRCSLGREQLDLTTGLGTGIPPERRLCHPGGLRWRHAAGVQGRTRLLVSPWKPWTKCFWRGAKRQFSQPSRTTTQQGW